MSIPIIQIFNAIGSLSEQAVADLSGIITFKKRPKGSHLLKIGHRADTMYFIERGLARAYYEHKGREVTDYFAIDGQFIGAVPSLFTGQPSKKGIQLIEDSDVYQFAASDFESLCARHHDLEHIARRMAQFGLIEEQERIESLRFNSMRERYELLERKYPGIMNRCPLRYIASYLGTTQVSISRIRSGIQ